jgi:hypothetical protein
MKVLTENTNEDFKEMMNSLSEEFYSIETYKWGAIGFNTS